MTQTTRVLPNSEEMEQALLSVMLNSPNIVPEILRQVKSEEFYTLRYKKIYKTYEDIFNKGDHADMVTLMDYMKRNNVFNDCGGEYGIVEIMQSSGLQSFMQKYIEGIKSTAILRGIVNAGIKITNVGYDTTRTGEDALSVVMSEVMDISKDTISSAMTAEDAVNAFSAELFSGNYEYITPPMMDDAIIRNGDLVVVAAGTSAGKTAMSLNWAYEWSKTKKVVYYEYEMSETDLISRLVSKESGIPLSDIRDVENLELGDFDTLQTAMATISSRNLKVEDVYCPVGQLMAKIRAEVMTGAEVIFIDHIGLIPFERRGNMNESKAVGVNITNPLKRLASELGVVIVILVQLNRAGQTGSYPKLYHLRDSGEIEQDATVVFMMWSDKSLETDGDRYGARIESELFNPDEARSDAYNLIRVGVEKNRNGRLFHKEFKFRGETFDYFDEKRKL